jgi:hypothetical protein
LDHKRHRAKAYPVAGIQADVFYLLIIDKRTVFAVQVTYHQFILFHTDFTMLAGDNGKRDAQVAFLTTSNQCNGTGQGEILYRTVFFQKEQIYLHKRYPLKKTLSTGSLYRIFLLFCK